MPLILDNRVCSNIGKRLDNRFWICQKWNPRYQQAIQNDDTGLPCAGDNKWLMKRKVNGRYSYGNSQDSNRNWTTPYQDIVVVFQSKAQDAALSPGGVATGHTISVNGSPQTTNYQSGSGTSVWVLRVPVLFDKDDAVTYSYNDAVGNTTKVSDGLEIDLVADVHVTNLLTKRIRFTLKKSDNTVAANETVKLAVSKYNSGVATEGPGDNVTGDNPQGGIWMGREMNATPTTDANGLLDIPYNGGSAVGGTVYVTVIRTNASPSESMIWPFVVV